MRIHIKTTPSNETVPFDHLKKLTGTIHKWIGKKNNVHGNLSLYSFSMLTNGKMNKEKSGLEFINGSTFFISTHNDDLLKEIVFNIQKDASMFCGLKVNEIVIQENPDLSKVEHFHVASPVFVKRTEGEKVKHYEYNEKETTNFLTETLQNKMKQAGINDETLKVSFDTTYSRAKTKVIHYNGIKNKANLCPIIIQGKPETKQFAWNVGIGNSTGVGFGAIK